MEKIIQLADRKIGDGQPCFIVAEVGLNHNGDMALAKETIDAAVEAGACAVKFQNYRTEDFLSDNSLTHEYVSQGKTIVESQFEMFRRCELTTEMLFELKHYCETRGIIFHSTPTSIETLSDLISIGVPLVKNGSDYLTHLPLIRAMADTGIPTVLATGMATRDEIEDAVAAFCEAGGTSLVLLHCTSSYPTKPTDVHLRKIETLREDMDCLVGLSDHSQGITAGIGALILGACFIEKHFTLDRNLPGPDHVFSMNPKELSELVKAVRTVEDQLGQSALGPTPSESLGRRDYRLSCVARKDLNVGHSITMEDIEYKRPGTGLPPNKANIFIGKKVVIKIPKGALLPEKGWFS
jgi:N-acetylneuraminate synthase/N,N'-diacetyllegionaminate synthase